MMEDFWAFLTADAPRHHADVLISSYWRQLFFRRFSLSDGEQKVTLGEIVTMHATIFTTRWGTANNDIIG
jgi:hypothetical protein